MTLNNIVSVMILIAIVFVVVLLLDIRKKINENKKIYNEIEQLKGMIENHSLYTKEQISELVTFNANYLMIDETLSKIHQSIDCLQQKLDTTAVVEKAKKAAVRKPRVAKEK